MQLNSLIARQIVERASKIIQYPVNVMDENGQIIGSSDPARLHRTHEGALLAIHDNRTVEINKTVASTLNGVKEGINFPILYQDQVIGVVGVSGVPDDVRSFGELVQMTAELIIEQAAMMAQMQWNNRHREELLSQLIEGSSLSDNQLMSIAARLDLDLTQPRVAALVKVVPRLNQSVTQEQLQKLVDLLEYPARDNIVGIVSVSQNEVVVLKPITIKEDQWCIDAEKERVKKLARRAKKECDFTIQIFVGGYFPGLLGLARSYETAKATLDSSVPTAQSTLFFDDHKLSVFISSIKQDAWKKELLMAPINRLNEKDSKGVLIKTLNCYFSQDCDLARTCRLLHIHRNTLRYRLDRVEEITGLNINRLDESIELYLALKSQ
ncbi:sugar diacid recognition domain-containing protein [Vibrio genomosp. F10 str. 9ZC157]|uniref:XRE family transcriptional regulator n=1 Tax=Vibrio genomosp. F10 str. ZF-129 TaxID=1187848 RepID=A0A1E5BH91_9VIBR|nr:sugar diacid recognition domain-containing protein [Vibrio genomosp. F10]OEE35977.1 XRE family transcriptional regulator [Vibrio genomosp. F10 str. ZF-129]OEE94265.1 XRE family transcriptional regulator [Vibrio genomosp. F10 str. 9ZC157]